MLPADIWGVIAQFMPYGDRYKMRISKTAYNAIIGAPYYDAWFNTFVKIPPHLLKTCHVSDLADVDPKCEYVYIDCRSTIKMSQLDANRRYTVCCATLEMDAPMRNNVKLCSVEVSGYFAPLGRLFKQPRGIAEWSLGEIYISNIRLRELPDMPFVIHLTVIKCSVYRVGRLDNAQCVDLSNNNISVLPDMPRCLHLTANRNRLKKLPRLSVDAVFVSVARNMIEDVGTLHCSDMFNAHHNKIRELTDMRCNNVNVSCNPLFTIATQSLTTILNMSHTKCRMLPELPVVSVLCISGCKMLTSIPIYKTLTRLSFVGCNILWIPAINGLKSLKYDGTSLYKK